MSIFINVPCEIVDKYKSLFVDKGTHIEFECDYNTLKLYRMFDQDEGKDVYYHPCNITAFFDVYRKFFENNFYLTEL